MREARYRRASRMEYDALSEADQTEIDGLVRSLEDDPRPDGRCKKLLNPDDPTAFLMLYTDDRWRIVYHASLEAGLIIYGITKRTDD